MGEETRRGEYRVEEKRIRVEGEAGMGSRGENSRKVEEKERRGEEVGRS